MHIAQTESGKPRFSVVVPCYNGQAYLEETLKTALAQTYPAIEIIVVNDGSTDRSREIACSMGPRVTVVDQENRGLSGARNTGARHASGDWIAFLDADDLWIPEKLALQAEAIMADPRLDIVYTDLYRLEADGSTPEVRVPPPAAVIERLWYETPILPSTVVARTQMLRAEPWDERVRLSEDWEYFNRISKRYVFGAVSVPTTYYRQHPESLSSKDWRWILESARQVSHLIQRDATCFERFRRRRLVEARLFASAAIAARVLGEPAWGYLLRSLAAWPFPVKGMRPRSAMLASMILGRIRGRKG